MQPLAVGKRKLFHASTHKTYEQVFFLVFGDENIHSNMLQEEAWKKLREMLPASLTLIAYVSAINFMPRVCCERMST